MKHLIFSFCLLAAASAAYASSPKKKPSVIPVDKVMTHDPVMAKQGDTYYLFATGHGISVMSSKDLKNWKFEKPVFEKAPQWAVETVKGYNGHTWAPDIIFHNGLNRDMWNAIDPNIIIDENGTPWMNFGSFWDGIKMVKLTPDMNGVAQPEEWYSLSRRQRTFNLDEENAGDGAVEAPFIMKHGDYYYLFVSFDYCCKGLKSDYKVMVGRSKTVTGPYLDKDGKAMNKGGGSLVIQGNKDYAGVGHNAAYHLDGKDYFISHAYSVAEEGAPKLIIREMTWTPDEWPVVNF